MATQKPLHLVLQSTDVPVAQNLEQPTTLEAYHAEKMKSINDKKTKVDEIKTVIKCIEQKLDDCDIPYCEACRANQDDLALQMQLLQSIEKDEDRLNYFLQVGDILFNYYDSQERIATGDHMQAKPKSGKHRTPANSVLNYFMPSPSATNTHVDDHASKPVTEKKPVAPTARDLIETDGLQRDKTLEKYLSIIDPSSLRGGVMPGAGIEPDYGCCPQCDTEMVFYHNEATLGCPACGYQDFILVDSEKPSYKDPPREISYFAYKKINHFNEWLAQFQAKESTDIPQDVLDLILTEIKKERILDPRTLKPQKLREILKKLRLNKFYEHIPHILHRMNAFCAPTMSREMEDKLRFMFKEIQPSFIRHCPRGRSNFLSYSYVLYKFCQLLELDDFLPCFPLLKSHEKLYMQDNIWQKICTDLGWEFIRTI